MEAAEAPVTARLGLGAGFRAIWNDHVLRANTALLVGAAAIASAETPLTSMLVLTHWQRGAMGLGLFEASLAVGFVVGAFACGPAVDRFGKGPTILTGLIGTGVAMTAVAVLPYWPALVLNGVSGVFNLLFFVPAVTLVQERAPGVARARVISSRGALMAVGGGLLVRDGYGALRGVRAAPRDGRDGTAARGGYDRGLQSAGPEAALRVDLCDTTPWHIPVPLHALRPIKESGNPTDSASERVGGRCRAVDFDGWGEEAEWTECTRTVP